MTGWLAAADPELTAGRLPFLLEADRRSGAAGVPAPPNFHAVVVLGYLGDLAVDVCDVLFFRKAANAPQLQRHAHSLQARGTNKVALDDMFHQLK